MYCQTSKELQKKAEVELNEVPTRTEDDIKHIQEWMEKEPQLNFKIDDHLILSFLRCSKFSLERTKKKINMYYTMRTFMPELFTNRDPLLPEMQDVLNSGLILPLPKPEDNYGCRIVLFNFSTNLDPDVVTVVNGIKLIFMVLDLLLIEDDYTIISGIKTITDCKDCSPKYLTQITPTIITKYSNLLQLYPFRISGMHALNCPTIFEFVHDIMKMFLSKKISERMYMFSESNFTKLYSRIPQHLLPAEFGGSNDSIKNLIVEWKKKVESSRDWFLKDEKLKSNESLRRGTPKTASDMFGMEGSFRKLNID